MSGVLEGIRIIELAGIGPAPFCAMMLADHGAEVIRIERPGARAMREDILRRSRRAMAIDLKSSEGIAVVRDLCRRADGLIEGFRPGVMERLGLGPQVLLEDNPRLAYGRMTGWGQDGPLALDAGHDINFIALAGALHAVGPSGAKPAPPLNLVGDFGGGGMMLAFGLVSAILRALRTGRGQVIDCAILDGTAVLMSMIWSLHARGKWSAARGANLLDGGAHFYDTYETADGGYICIGSIEPQFYARLRMLVGLAGDPEFDPQMDGARWPVLKDRLRALFLTKTRDEWCALLMGQDVCFAPVLSMTEAPRHPHNAQRGVFVEVDGVMQPAPAPRFSATPAPAPSTRAPTSTDAMELLQSCGYDSQRIEDLRRRGIVG